MIIDFFYHQKNRSYLLQFFVLAVILGIFSFLGFNAASNLKQNGIATGFSFLNREAGFEIGESSISFFSDNTYARALLVGLLNTLKIAFIGNIFAILIGVIVGVSRLSHHWAIAKMSQFYIEIIRNIPLLLQLLFWYTLFTEFLPGVKQAYNPLPGVFISNRGINFPYLFDFPVLQGFNFVGGGNITPELTSLLLGLVLYTSAFNAEIIRSGIASIDKGQKEASISLGLGQMQTFFLVIIPQALRIIFPPLISQFLNLIKNSSLAVAIGYPDFVSIANTTLNQTGQAIELVSLIMVLYLSLSLSSSFILNFVNKKMAIIER